MAQMWPPPKPKLGQDEFDEAVKTNIEDFDMSVRRTASAPPPVSTCAFKSPLRLPPQPEEAVTSACEEFTVQGYDLKGVIKKVGGGNTERCAWQALPPNRASCADLTSPDATACPSPPSHATPPCWSRIMALHPPCSLPLPPPPIFPHPTPHAPLNDTVMLMHPLLLP
jgi:hypothetical protein